VDGEIRTSAASTTAELVKLIKNTYRHINIALANEIAKRAHDYGVDSREAIDLANEHPQIDFLEPGPGVGGHCLPVDPWFLGECSDEVELISTAKRVNDGTTEFILRLLEEELVDLPERHIAILGIAYNGNVEDKRMSPGIRLAQELIYDPEESEHGRDSRDRDGSIHDPHVDESIFSTLDLESALSGADAAVVTTDHDEFAELSPDTVNRHMKTPFILDTKGILDDEWKETSTEILTL
jgi:UDP-N-acetyl-D-mannosaminuronic acid dehydrogenase